MTVVMVAVMVMMMVMVAVMVMMMVMVVVMVTMMVTEVWGVDDMVTVWGGVVMGHNHKIGGTFSITTTFIPSKEIKNITQNKRGKNEGGEEVEVEVEVEVEM